MQALASEQGSSEQDMGERQEEGSGGLSARGRVKVMGFGVQDFRLL